ncbi:MAG: D-alanine--D-alanine ligase family protein [Acidimicrobiales bacterium]
MAPRTRLVVLYGGRSAEHDVSCVSARHVVDALDPGRYEVVPVGVARDGRWVDGRPALATSTSTSASASTSTALPSPDLAPEAHVLPWAGLEHLAGAPGLPGAARTVVFPLVHGPMGEDGTVQGLLEVAQLPYVGAGVLASALCMDKATAKEVLAFHGVPQAPWRSLRAGEAGEAALDRAAAALGFPMFVKPANLGSSIGISRVHDRASLAPAVALAAAYDDVVVLEQGVAGREVEVAVLGNERPRASLPGEIVSSDGFYDYEEKYVSNRAKLLVPAPLDDAEVAAAQALAVRTFRALRVEGMARVDFFYDEHGRWLVNEVNTVPGFTPISMYPKLWEVSGLPTPSLLDELVALALERHDRRRAHRVDR